MAYSVSFAPAASQFRKLPVLIQQRLRPHIDSPAAVPRPAASVKMHGEQNLYRVRVSDYRIVYYVFDAGKEVLIVKIAHCRDVYR